MLLEQEEKCLIQQLMWQPQLDPKSQILGGCAVWMVYLLKLAKQVLLFQCPPLSQPLLLCIVPSPTRVCPQLCCSLCLLLLTRSLQRNE